MRKHHTRRIRTTLLTTLAVALMAAFTSGSGSAAAGDKLRRVEKAAPNEYIVVFNDDVGRAGVAPLARRLAAAHGAETKFIYDGALKGFAARMPEKAALALSRNPHVAFVEENSVGQVEACQSAPQGGGAFWGIDRIDQRNGTDNTYCWDTTGAGVHAYVLDTGIWVSHQDFGGRASVFFDAFGGDGIDRNNHGTMVAGVIGGQTRGVAKSVQLHAAKVCDDFGFCSAWDVIAAIDNVVNYGARPAVINMSLAFPVTTSLDQAVRNAMAAGVLCVSGAGNDNGVDASTRSPARVMEGVTVAASTREDRRASYSNIGRAIDFYAPGGEAGLNQFIPVPASGWHCGGCNNNFDGFTGTSAAAPHATGVAALYLEANPTASAYVAGGELRKNASQNKIINAGYATQDDLLYSAFNKSVQHIAGTEPVFRYWNGTSVTDHFYTMDWNELGPGNHGWDFEFVGFYMFRYQQPGTIPLYEYWNPYVGDHYYTTNFNELGWGAHGWTFSETIGYVWPRPDQGGNPPPGALPLHQYWNEQTGDHFYTTNFDEMGGGAFGYAYVRVECYVSP